MFIFVRAIETYDTLINQTRKFDDTLLLLSALLEPTYKLLKNNRTHSTESPKEKRYTHILTLIHHYSFSINNRNFLFFGW